MTVAKTGMPVTIRSDTKQTIFLQTPGTQVYGPSTVPYTFTTGLTVDIIARILDGGLVDLNLNPTLSTIAATSPAQPGTTTQVPVISTPITTPDLPSPTAHPPTTPQLLPHPPPLTTTSRPR